MKNDLRKTAMEQNFFQGFSPSHLELVAGCARNEVLASQKFLFREGGAADTFYILREGGISIESHQPGSGTVIVETLQTGSVVGWSWLIPPYRWHFDARALSKLHLLSFDGACLRKKMAADSTLAVSMYEKFFPVVLDRLQNTRLRMLDFYRKPEGTTL